MDGCSDKLQKRKNRNTTEEVKDAICTISYGSDVSVPEARIAVQAVCGKLYKHKFLLEPLPHTTVSETEEPQEPKYRKPRTAEQCSIYKDILPSAKTVNDYIHKKSLHQEFEASKLLANKKDTTKVTLYHDSTTISRIEGERPCLILNFMNKNPDNCHLISLKLLFFALEDNANN